MYSFASLRFTEITWVIDNTKEMWFIHLWSESYYCVKNRYIVISLDDNFFVGKQLRSIKGLLLYLNECYNYIHYSYTILIWCRLTSKQVENRI